MNSSTDSWELLGSLIIGSIATGYFYWLLRDRLESKMNRLFWASVLSVLPVLLFSYLLHAFH